MKNRAGDYVVISTPLPPNYLYSYDGASFGNPIKARTAIISV
jgi:hypothetical protein